MFCSLLKRVSIIHITRDKDDPIAFRFSFGDVLMPILEKSRDNNNSKSSNNSLGRREGSYH